MPDTVLKGYLPAGWYPTALAAAGDQLLVVNGKGDAARVPHDFSQGTSVTSPLYLFQGRCGGWRFPIRQRCKRRHRGAWRMPV